MTEKLTPFVNGEPLLEEPSEELEALVTEMLARELGIDVEATRKAQEYDQSWERMVPEMFPVLANSPMGTFHKKWWSWVWTVEPGVPNKGCAFFVFRGGGKSASAEMGIVSLAARGKIHFALYVCATQENANRHVASIATLLESPQVQAMYPDLGKPKVGLYGNQKAWRQAELQTDSGFILRGVGLDAAIRGIRVENFRPDFICFDDIDGKKDTPETIKKKEDVITSDILPARARWCVVAFAQNLIHRNSIATKIARKESEFLRGIQVIGPIPAVYDLEYEIADDNTVTLTGGTPSWPEGFGLDLCEEMLNEEGPETFLLECQHDVDRMAAGSVIAMWDERRHISTYGELMAYVDSRGVGDEFRDYDGSFRWPDGTRIGMGHDWGATMPHPAVTTWWARLPERLNWLGLGGVQFKYRSIMRPRNRDELAEMDPLTFGELMISSMKPWEFDMLEWLVMSHERLSERNTYHRLLSRNLNFTATKTCSKTGGIPQLQAYYQIDKSKPHLLRRYPDGYVRLDPDTNTEVDLSGQNLAGMPGIIWLVANGQGELGVDEDGELTVRGATDETGMKRGRWEITRWHWKRTATGTEQQVPHELDQDEMDGDRYLAFMMFPQQARLSKEERVKQRVAERLEAIRAEDGLAALEYEVLTASQRASKRLMDYKQVLSEEVGAAEAAHGPRRSVRRPGGRRKGSDGPLF